MFDLAKEEYLSIPGGNMLCISFGKGKRPLVSIPGLRMTEMKGTGTAAALYYRCFAASHTVYLFDRKEPAAEGCTIREMAADIAAAMKQLGLRHADVIGVSQGGMIAQELAVNDPELVQKLVLGVTLSRPNQTVEAALTEWIRLAEQGDMAAVARDYAERASSERTRRRNIRFLPLALKLQKPVPAARFLALAKACLTHDTYDRLDQIRCPVLVLGGAQDKVVSGEASREIAEKLRCECHIYPDQSHEAYNEAKDFNQRIADFFNAETV
ncbi:MAG: alpha/beta hydrolase [Oscillospiraceae bacterium]|nr:alpha/beta hydrolase [Oscillospiraceae bacterium]